MILPGVGPFVGRRPRHGEAGDERREGLHLLPDQLVEPRHRFGGLRVAHHGRPLVLPEIEVAPRQLFEFVGVLLHKTTI
jgi:hypothetical protein